MSYGPNAIATWANAVTVARILLAPVLFFTIDEWGASWGTLVFWLLLSATDGIDGFLARRHGTTRSGAFLDPLADKVLVLGAMLMLVNNDVFAPLPVAIIAVREFVISIYRSVVGTQGKSLPASPLAKVKTVTQQLAVACALAPFLSGASWTWQIPLWIAVVLTVVSGLQYLVGARRVGVPAA